MNHWITQQNPEQEQDCPDDVNFLGDAAKELQMGQSPIPKQEEAPEDEEEKKRKEKEKEELEKKNKQVSDPNKPNFKREPSIEKKEEPAKKPDKNESVEILRTERDKAREDLATRTKIEEELKTKLGIQDLVVLAPLTAYLSEHLEGVVTEEKVTDLLNGIKGSQTKLTEYETKLKETTGKLREVNIEFDPEFQRDYIAPWQEAQNTLFIDFATVVPDGEGKTKVIGMESAKKLYDSLTKAPEKMDAGQVKALLLEYVNDYKKETNEDPVGLPTPTQLMGSLRNFTEKRNKMVNAHQTWEQEKETSKKRTALQEQESTKALTEKQQRERGRLAQTAFNNFPFKDFEGIIEEKDIESYFDEEYALGENIFNPKKKEDVPSWDALLTRGVNARLAPILLEKLKALHEDNKILKAKVSNGEVRGNGGGNPTKASDGKADFLGDAKSLLASL